MLKKYLFAIPIIFLFVALLSLWLFPEISTALGMIVLFLNLALSTYTIYTKHNGTEHARAKILKEVGVMVLTLILIIFLGGIASMLANYQVSMRWGAVAGLVSAIAASFLIGYIVRAGLGRLAR